MPGCCISMHSDPKTKSGMSFGRTIMVAIAANMHAPRAPAIFSAIFSKIATTQTPIGAQILHEKL
jgi:hypothetical protein